jgi:hypothetical protein
MRLAYLLIASLVLASCADATPDDLSDGEAETAAEQAVGKADSASFAGVYATHATTLKDGDVPSLELRVIANPGVPTKYSYIRSRCYHASCSARIPETDAYSVYTSSAGKTYVRFWSVTMTYDPNNGVTETPVVADVYEIKTWSKGIKLRKSFSTRWQTLYTASPSLMCHDSHGTWASGTCTCPGNMPNTFPAFEFVSGAGGCIATPGANESNCDDSHGLWTDDDSTLIGSYCRCGVGRFVDSTGGCTNI